jgi:hypothetical protein
VVGSVAGNVTHQGYRRIKIASKLFLMHRLIYRMHTGVGPGSSEIDHINSNKSDSRIENLRLASKAQNQQNNPLYRNSATGQRGVHWHKQHRKYCAAIQVNGRRHHIGLFGCAEEAGRAYDEAAIKLHGPFARPNNLEMKSD